MARPKAFARKQSQDCKESQDCKKSQGNQEKTLYTEADFAKLYFEEGLSLRRISERLKLTISTTTIGNILTKAGYKLRGNYDYLNPPTRSDDEIPLSLAEKRKELKRQAIAEIKHLDLNLARFKTFSDILEYDIESAKRYAYLVSSNFQCSGKIPSEKRKYGKN